MTEEEARAWARRVIVAAPFIGAVGLTLSIVSGAAWAIMFCGCCFVVTLAIMLRWGFDE